MIPNIELASFLTIIKIALIYYFLIKEYLDSMTILLAIIELRIIHLAIIEIQETFILLIFINLLTKIDAVFKIS